MYELPAQLFPVVVQTDDPSKGAHWYCLAIFLPDFNRFLSQNRFNRLEFHKGNKATDNGMEWITGVGN